MHIAESQHWYSRDGKPAYTVKAKSGADRNVTLADARKLNLVPSVTGIIKCAAPGIALEKWKREQLLLAALTLPRGEHELEEEWIFRVHDDSRQTALKAAERGTTIHAAIQGAYEGEPPAAGMWNHIQGVEEAIRNHFGQQSWAAERSFACRLGFGGKTDLSAKGIVIDFKTKEYNIGERLRTFDEHQMQLAAYRQGLKMPKARCAIVYVSVTNPGLAHVVEMDDETLTRGWRMFLALLDYWKARSGFESGWLTEAA